MSNEPKNPKGVQLPLPEGSVRTSDGRRVITVVSGFDVVAQDQESQVMRNISQGPIGHLSTGQTGGVKVTTRIGGTVVGRMAGTGAVFDATGRSSSLGGPADPPHVAAALERIRSRAGTPDPRPMSPEAALRRAARLNEIEANGQTLPLKEIVPGNPKTLFPWRLPLRGLFGLGRRGIVLAIKAFFVRLFRTGRLTGGV
jgi:hypothetical protein